MKVKKVTNKGGEISFGISTEKGNVVIRLNPKEFVFLKNDFSSVQLRIYEKKNIVSLEDVEITYTKLEYNKPYPEGTKIEVKYKKPKKIINVDDKELEKHIDSVKKYMAKNDNYNDIFDF